MSDPLDPTGGRRMTQRNGANHRWWPERTALLRELWDRGWSANRIAQELGSGLSRSAVIGKVHRLKLTRRKASPSVKVIRPHPKHRPVRREKFQMQIPGPPRPLPKTSPPAPQSSPVSFMDAGPEHCRWINGEPAGPDTIFCGAPKQDGSSYCPYHFDRSITVYRPTGRTFIPLRKEAA